jgi:Cu-Zn family superoxide dismutase
MKNIKTLLAISILSVLAACTPSTKGNTNAEAKLMAKSDSDVTGTASFSQNKDSVSLVLDIQNAVPGLHGVHIHEKGDCSAADGSSAGGHWNPTEDTHGKWGTDNHHYGDIGNIKIDSNGKGQLLFSTTKWNLAQDDKFSIVGKSIVIHSGEDDLTSQPSGDAGYKVACGVIKPKK